jgi:hypothetical protein
MNNFNLQEEKGAFVLINKKVQKNFGLYGQKKHYHLWGLKSLDE